VKRYSASIAKITGGFLLVIFAVYASYLKIGLSLAFEHTDWPKVYRDLVVFVPLLILGAWLIFRDLKQMLKLRRKPLFSLRPNQWTSQQSAGNLLLISRAAALIRTV